jgi:hypothetical protein
MSMIMFAATWAVALAIVSVVVSAIKVFAPSASVLESEYAMLAQFPHVLFTSALLTASLLLVLRQLFGMPSQYVIHVMIFGSTLLFASKDPKSDDVTSDSVSGAQTSQTLSPGSLRQTQGSTSSGVAPSSSHRPNVQNAHTLTSTLGARPNVVNISEDFILLCFRVGRYLTKRHDLSVSGITRDRELFEAFRAQYKARTRWVYRNLSLWNVQEINFVKVSFALSSVICICLLPQQCFFRGR